MSDTSEDTLQSERDHTNDKEESVCRDFIRGICDRKFCKYKHETEQKPLNFCHDFQNNICPRPNCKFIHCTPEEVEEYKQTGEMSIQILAEATRKNQLPGTPPICNQFKKGACRRTFCKYRHLTKEQEDAEIMGLIRARGGKRTGEEARFAGRPLTRNGFEEYGDGGGGPPGAKRFMAGPEAEVVMPDGMADASRHRGIFKGYFAGNPPSAVLNRVDPSSDCGRCLMLEEENNYLHKEVAQLQRQVSDLTATNEFLLDQNANLRVSGKRRSAAIEVPTVAMANNGGQQPPQPQPPQVIRTVTASVATVPVSLATVTTCNPVSGNPVSIAGCPAVSMASPAQILAPSQQILVTTNPTSQLALANSSQAQLAIAQQNLANNLAQQAQPQLTSQAQQLALATSTQQLTSQAQHMANQQLALASAATQPQQLALANASQAQQLALANPTQQLTSSQAQQLALANSNQQLTSSQAQQLAVANQQLLAQQSQQMELHRNGQINSISTSQAIAMSNAASQPMVSYPIMTQSINHALTH